MPGKEVRTPAFEGEWLCTPGHTETLTPDHLDVVACQAAAFEWAESFDNKDWDRLAEVAAPNLYVRAALLP